MTARASTQNTQWTRGRFFGVVLALVWIVAVSPAKAESEVPRVISVGGAVTEIIYALDMQHVLVARDTTSTFPTEAEALPDVGYMRALSPEGTLSVDPDLIIAENGSGPAETLQVLKQADVSFVTVPASYDRAGISDRIMAVAGALDVTDRGRALAKSVDQQLANVSRPINEASPRVLFILSLQGGRVMASGTGTAAEGIINLAGAANAITAFEGYKPLTDEAVIEAAPDVILMMERGGDHAVSDETLFAHPAISLTPAARSQSVVRLDGLLLLGFGPRTPAAVGTLSRELGTAVGG